MFSDKRSAHKLKRRGASFHESAVTILTPGCHFNGRLFCRGSSRIGGTVEGEIISEGILIIEDEAHIAAAIKADEVVIQGHVKGKLVATGRVELTATSRFEGDITTPSLVINEGAQFNGTTTMKLAEREADKMPIVENVEKLHKKGASRAGEVALPKVPEVGAQ